MDWSFPQVTQSELNNKLEYKYSGNWAGRPEASTLNFGDLIFIEDMPITGAIGTILVACPAIDFYIPLSGNFFIGSQDYPVDSDNSGTEQALFTSNAPVGSLIVVQPIIVNFAFSKSGATDSATVRIHAGSDGDITDPVVATHVMSSSDRSAVYDDHIATIVGGTTVNCAQKLGEISGASTVPWPADITIPSINDNGLKITISVQLSGTTDTATLRYANVFQRGLG